VATEKLWLQCSECKQLNYITSKNRTTNPDRLSLKKYCSVCRKHTVHNETRVKK